MVFICMINLKEAVSFIMVSICAVGDNVKAGMELTLEIKAPCKS